MVLNVVGSNPTGHPERDRLNVGLFFFAVACFDLSARADTPTTVTQRKNPGCYIFYPPEPTISWTEVDFDTICPQQPVFSWTGAAQSMLSEPFGVARAA